MPETSRRAAQIAAEAFDRPSDQRGSFLENACGNDTALRADVEALLAAAADAGSFLDQPAVRAERAPDPRPLAGPPLGRFPRPRRPPRRQPAVDTDTRGARPGYREHLAVRHARWHSNFGPAANGGGWH